MSVLAFPTAVGYGKDSVGGRGGTVMFVTTLNDSGTGSLREAFEASGPRIIIPLIGGRVNVTSPIQVDNPFVTYAGQGGVGDGLMITKEGQNGPILEIRTNDVIIRHLKIRYAENYLNDTNADSLRVIGSDAHDVIIDHCSLSWSPDGNLDVTQGAYNVTVQNCILHQCLADEKNSLNKYQVNKITYYNNVFSSTEQRNPAVASSGPNDPSGYDDDPNMHPEFEVINNVVFRFNYAVTFSRQYKAKLNWIGNRLLMEGNKRRGLQSANFTTINEVAAEDRVQVYMFGNTDDKWRTSITTPTDWEEEFSLSQGTQGSAYEDNPPQGWVEGTNGIYYRIPQEFRKITPHQTPIISDGNTIVDAGLANNETLWESLRDTVGASLPNRDSEDAEVVTIINSYITDYDKARIATEYPQNDANGSNTFPVITSGTPLLDSNSDGIPDTWEAANMPSGATANDTAPNGYTWIENYLNGVDSEAQLAFPTAMGAGAYTSGARGQEVYHVTNLNATGSGSFRDALSQSNRTIVFDVSGIIEMIPEFEDNDILIEADNLTIAGQTAPEGNITITGARLVFRGSNVIVRYLKFRATDNVGGAINSANKSDVIFDHLSVSSVETNQVAIGMTNNPGIPAYNRTTQNSLIAYCGLGMIIGDTTPPNDTDNETYSLINNAFVFTGHRIPAKIAGAVHMDIINNLSHGHSARLIRIDDWSYNLNHVGNYYQMGRPMQQMHTAYYGTRNGLIYENDNYYDPNFSGDEWERFLGDEAPLPASKFVQSPFTYQNSETLNILSSGDLKTQILPHVGCYKYINDSGQVVEDRDSVDSQAIDDLINDVTRGSVSEFVDITISDIPTSNNTRPGGFYGTNQHIPTTWLTANGYADTTTIHNEVESDGYTVLEHYINQVDSSDAPTPPDPPTSAVSGSTRSLILKGII